MSLLTHCWRSDFFLLSRRDNLNVSKEPGMVTRSHKQYPGSFLHSPVPAMSGRDAEKRVNILHLLIHAYMGPVLSRTSW